VANSKLSQLSAATALTEDDLMYVVDSPASSAVSYKMTVASLRAALMRQYASTATVTVANTASATTLIGAGQGSATLDAAYLNTIGKQLHIKAWGVVSNTGTPTLAIIVKLGAVTLATTGDVVQASGQTNSQFELDFWIVTRATGATGNVFAHGLARAAGVLMPLSNTAVSSAVDLTSALAVDVQADWGTGDPANTISAHLLDILKVN